MSNLIINSSNSRYEVTFISDGFDASQLGADVFLVDSNLKDTFDCEKVIYVEAIEKLKTLSTCEYVIDEIKNLGGNRHTILGVVGGGTIQDIGTLVSSLYMRGIKWKYIPTTMMAMMDSCIGGKSSINSRNQKNVIGNFHPPSEIVIVPSFLQTLSRQQIAAGLLEGIKISYARGQASFQNFQTLLETLFLESDLNLKISEELISCSLEAKKWFIEVDEFDKKERQLLNFGHTFGHALEVAADYEIAHGIAIGIGMLAALSFQEDTLSNLESSLREEVVKILHLDSRVGDYRNLLDSKAFMDAFAADKKHSNSDYVLILSRFGKLERRVFSRKENIPIKAWNCVDSVLKEFSQ